MSSEANKATVRKIYEEVVGRRNYHLIDDIVSPDFFDHNAQRYGWALGRDGFREHAEFLHSVFADVEIVVEEVVADGDRVVAFWSLTGTHRGEVWGVAPTGRRVSGGTTSLFRFKDGRVVEYEARPDRLTMLVQLGSFGSYAQTLGQP